MTRVDRRQTAVAWRWHGGGRTGGDLGGTAIRRYGDTASIAGTGGTAERRNGGHGVTAGTASITGAGGTR
jgi:hypothetical protein